MREGRRRPASRPGVVVALCALLVACSGAPATQAPDGGTGAPASAAPGIGTADPPTDQPVSTGPLPAPILSSVDEIVAAMADPAQAEQVVVSMLVLLGIGLYTPDGTAIRAGTETSDEDFYLFEPAARGLANMLRELDDPEGGTPFRDFHAAVASGGYGGTAEQLAAAYADAYAAQPDAAVSRLIAALDPVHVEAHLSDFEAWLLLLDGFIHPNSATSAMAAAGDAMPAVAAGGGSWGVARRNVQSSGAMPLNLWTHQYSLLQAVLRAWRITVSVSPAAVHEGHAGQPGDPATVTATVAGPMQALTSPFSSVSVMPAPEGAEGVRVAWAGNGTLNQHGTIVDPATRLDLLGEARTTYIPQAEAADGNGLDREEIGQIHAGFARSELLLQLYGEFALPYAHLFAGFTYVNKPLYVGWHEVAEAVIKIIWTDFYNGVEDRITFLGNLTTTDGDPQNGGLYTGTGTASGSRVGYAACNDNVGGVPSGTVPATFNGVLTGNGTIMISAYADIFTALAGISTAPMEVPITGGRAVYTSSEVGELCPHSSDGEMIVTMLALP